MGMGRVAGTGSAGVPGGVLADCRSRTSDDEAQGLPHQLACVGLMDGESDHGGVGAHVLERPQ
jgi:hypothetical protein